MEFTTRAFVGRVDVAVSLSQEPNFVPEETKPAWNDARKGPASEGVLDRANEVWQEVVKVERRIRTVLREADRDTLQAVGVVATAAAMLGCAVFFREVGLSAVPEPRLEDIPTRVHAMPSVSPLNIPSITSLVVC